MIELLLIGIGTGNPDHLTLEAVKALKSADLVLVPLKGEAKADLADVRRAILAEHVTSPPARIVTFDMPVRNAHPEDYRAEVDRWHDAIAERWKAAIDAHLRGAGVESLAGDTAERVAARVALLVWGDASLYDSTLRIAERLARTMPLEVRVIPGLTSIQLLTAAHRIPLNEIGGTVMTTTGRQLREGGWPAGAETVVVMLDGGCAFTALPASGLTIWWGAYLGLPQQITMSGALEEIGHRIVDERARARGRHGWIMDVYILRKAGSDRRRSEAASGT